MVSYLTESHSSSIKGAFWGSRGYGLVGILPKRKYILAKGKGLTGMRQKHLQKV